MFLVVFSMHLFQFEYFCVYIVHLCIYSTFVTYDYLIIYLFIYIYIYIYIKKKLGGGLGAMLSHDNSYVFYVKCGSIKLTILT